jgi:hypothetical protein
VANNLNNNPTEPWFLPSNNNGPGSGQGEYAQSTGEHIATHLMQHCVAGHAPVMQKTLTQLYECLMLRNKRGTEAIHL